MIKELWFTKGIRFGNLLFFLLKKFGNLLLV
jgi:hypothetical protein